MLKKIIIRYKESIWFLPSLFMLGAIVSAVVIAEVDSTLQKQFYELFPPFLLTSVSLTSDILSVIATSLLTMTAITFSTIMIVFSIYSSQFSPRTLQNFISDRLTQIVLGIFIAGFTYSVVSLLLMQENKDGSIVFTVIFAILLSLVCIGYFIRFIQYITVSIQVNNLIEEINNEIFNTLRQRTKTIDAVRKNCKVLSGLSVKKIDMKKKRSTDFYAHRAGHIQLFNIRGLIKLAQEEKAVIETTRRVGDFVT